MITRAYPLAIISVILFLGCAKPYIAPERPDAATLTFTNKSEIEVNLLGFKNAEDCSGGILKFNDRRKLGPGENTTISVIPEEAFSFLFFAANKPSLGYGCFIPATFTPQKGIEYFSTFDLMYLGCGSHIANEITPTNRSLGSFRYLTNNTSLWETVEDPLVRGICTRGASTSTSSELVSVLCYVSIAKIENGNVVREPSFTLRRQIEPAWSDSDPYCQ